MCDSLGMAKLELGKTLGLEPLSEEQIQKNRTIAEARRLIEEMSKELQAVDKLLASMDHAVSGGLRHDNRRTHPK